VGADTQNHQRLWRNATCVQAHLHDLRGSWSLAAQNASVDRRLCSYLYAQESLYAHAAGRYRTRQEVHRPHVFARLTEHGWNNGKNAQTFITKGFEALQKGCFGTAYVTKHPNQSKTRSYPKQNHKTKKPWNPYVSRLSELVEVTGFEPATFWSRTAAIATILYMFIAFLWYPCEVQEGWISHFLLVCYCRFH